MDYEVGFHASNIIKVDWLELWHSLPLSIQSKINLNPIYDHILYSSLFPFHKLAYQPFCNLACSKVHTSRGNFLKQCQGGKPDLDSPRHNIRRPQQRSGPALMDRDSAFFMEAISACVGSEHNAESSLSLWGRKDPERGWGNQNGIF